MTEAEARGVVVAALRRIAPEVDAETLDPSADFRAEADLDSVDFLNLLVAVEERTGVAVPDRSAPRLTSIAALAAYVAEHA